MRISRLTAALAVAALTSSLATACGDDGTGLESVQGTYVLQSIGGNQIPFVEEDDITRVEFLGGSITLRSDGTCTTVFEYRETDLETGDVVEGPVRQTCTFTLSGNTLSFDFGTGDLDHAHLEGNTIQANVDGDIWVFVRQ